MAVCWTLLEFEAELETTSNDQISMLGIKEMIKGIIDYRDKFQILPEEEKNKIFSPDLHAKFINHICVEEGLGLQEKSDTVALLKEIQQNNPSSPRQHKKFKRQLSQSEQETKNVYDAWRYLNTLAPETDDDYDSIAGLMHIDICIRKTHTILMREVLDEEKTPAGQFSTLEREATYKGKTHKYPKFDRETEAEEAVQVLVDRYNALVNEVKKIGDIEERMYKMFKCAAYLLFNLITIHPFSDGNGRVCRLLCSYVLSVMFPFPSPIYNVYSPTDKSDYVDSLIKARDRTPSHPCELTGLIIESNYHVWKAFFETEE